MIIAERHHSKSTRVVGLFGTAAVVAGVGVLLVNMRQPIDSFVQPKNLEMFVVEPPKLDEPKPVKKVAPKEDTKPIAPKVMELPPPDIVIETPVENPPLAVIVEDPAPPALPAPPADPAPAGPPATRPRLVAGAKPAYPPDAQRAGASGTTTLNLCVSRTGQVTQASVIGSSGNASLDKAALAWIKRERFKPGTENGQPVDMCDSQLSYVWELPKR